MAARAIGSGTISFGLVSIPVKVFSSTRSDTTISFNMLHKDKKERVKQQYIVPPDPTPVPRSDMVKGYEFAKGQYVIFTNEELKAFEADANKAIAIREFLPESAVDPIYYDKAYYLGPDKGGERAYALLRAAMKHTQRVALAKYAARGKQYLVMVRPMEFGLVMQQLHYEHEIRAIDDVPIGDADVDGNELTLATQLIEQIATEEFKPDQYKDEVRERIEAAIEEKVAGKEVTAPAAETPKAQIIDLMEALKKSIGDDAEAGSTTKKTKAKTKKKASKRAKASKKTAKKTKAKKKAAKA